MLSAAARVYKQAVKVEGSRVPPPVISYLSKNEEGHKWRLEARYGIWHDETTLRVYEGFTFDLASIPRALWSIIAPFELSIVAPLIHDYLYRAGGILPGGATQPRRTYTRKESDVVFRDLMEKEGVSWWRRWSAYGAVRAFGSSSWQD